MLPCLSPWSIMIHPQRRIRPNLLDLESHNACSSCCFFLGILFYKLNFDHEIKAFAWYYALPTSSLINNDPSSEENQAKPRRSGIAQWIFVVLFLWGFFKGRDVFCLGTRIHELNCLLLFCCCLLSCFIKIILTIRLKLLPGVMHCHLPPWSIMIYPQRRIRPNLVDQESHNAFFK